MEKNTAIHAAVNVAHIGTFLLTAFLVAITVWPLPWAQKGDHIPIMVGVLVAGLVVSGLLQWKAASVTRSPVAHPPTVRTPDSSWISFIKSEPEEAAPSKLGEEKSYPQKVRCEFLNSADVAFKVKTLTWDSSNRGMNAFLPKPCLQIRIASRWWPQPDGVEELHVPPGESFRLWLSPTPPLSQEQFLQRVGLGNLGIVHLLVNGKDVAVTVG